MDTIHLSPLPAPPLLGPAVNPHPSPATTNLPCDASPARAHLTSPQPQPCAATPPPPARPRTHLRHHLALHLHRRALRHVRAHVPLYVVRVRAPPVPALARAGGVAAAVVSGWARGEEGGVRAPLACGAPLVCGLHPAWRCPAPWPAAGRGCSTTRPCRLRYSYYLPDPSHTQGLARVL